MSAQARPLDRTIHRDEIKLKRGYAKLCTRRTDHARSQRKSAHIARMRLSQVWMGDRTRENGNQCQTRGNFYAQQQSNNLYKRAQIAPKQTREARERGARASSGQRKRRAIRICGRGGLKTKQNKSQNSNKLAQHQKMSSTMHRTRTKHTESR